MRDEIQNFIQRASGQVDHFLSESLFQFLNVERIRRKHCGHVGQFDLMLGILVSTDPDIILILVQHYAEQSVRLRNRVVGIGAQRVQSAGRIDHIQALRFRILRHLRHRSPACGNLAVSHGRRDIRQAAAHPEQNDGLPAAFLLGRGS